MTRLRWIWPLSFFALLSLFGFYSVTLFQHKRLGFGLLPVVPVIILFFLPSAVRTIANGMVEFFKSFTWWHGLWVLSFLSGLVWRARLTQDIHAEPVDGFALLRICLETIVGSVLLARLFYRRTLWLRSLFTGIVAVMAIYALLSVASTTWSVNPPWTFYKSVEYLVDISVLAAILVSVRQTEDYEKLVNLAWVLLGLMVLSAWIGAVVDPVGALKLNAPGEGPLNGRLNGLVPIIDANSVGEWSAILGIIALCRLLYDPERKFDHRWYFLLFASATVTMIYAQTRAANAGFFIAVVLLLLLTRKYSLAAFLCVGGSLATATMLLYTNAGQVIAGYLMRGQSLQRAQDVSGRLEMWVFGIHKFLERPLIGYGGYAGGRFVVLTGIGRYETGDILSSWLEPLVDVGILGTILIAIVVGMVWWSLLRSRRSPLLELSERRLAIELSCAMTIITARSFVTGNLIVHDAMPFLLTLGYAELVRRRINSVRWTARKLRAA